MGPFESHHEILRHVEPLGISGRVSGVRGLTVSVSDFPAPIGAGCRIVRGGSGVDARVIGLTERETLVMPLGAMTGISRGDRVVLASAQQAVPTGAGMLGRVLDGALRPIDGRGDFRIDRQMPIWPEPIAPMRRRRIGDQLATGIRAVDAMLTVGRGQRMGIFSGSGVGKSVLLGMIGRYTSADVIVIALIGERGREVRDFIERDLGADGLKRSVVVVSTGDEPPLMRVQAAAAAAAVAEYFRDRGSDVLLLMDSLTRLATAQRQIGLVAGEPPATKGYTPSVFNLIPQLLERSGRTSEGSITGFYAVLVEGDDLSEPVSDAVRSVTDGHVLLSRELADRGHYPAVDVLGSISRVMIDVTDREHRAAAKTVQKLIALYADVEELVSIGAYQGGVNSDYDLAIKVMPWIRQFLTQEIDEHSTTRQTGEYLQQLYRRILFEKEQTSARPSIRA